MKVDIKYKPGDNVYALDVEDFKIYETFFRAL